MLLGAICLAWIALIVVVVNVQALPVSKRNAVYQDVPSAEISTFNLTVSSSSIDVLEENNDTSFCKTVDNGLTIKNGMTNSTYLWKTLKYYLDGEYSEAEKKNIKLAVAILRQMVSCVTFEEIDTLPGFYESHVVVKRGKACFVVVGNVGLRQGLVLTTKCLTELSTIIHEFMHSLGVEHEHNRADRDDYVYIHWDNIRPEDRHNFQKVDSWAFSNFGVAYNPRSIMHYGLHAGSINGRSTINWLIAAKSAPNEPISLGNIETTGLQRTDIDKIRKMYSCGYF